MMDMDSYLNYVGGMAGAAAISGAAAVATALYIRSCPKPLVLPQDIHHQAITLDTPDQERVSAYCKDGKLKECIYEDVRTIHDVMERGARVSKNGNCLGYRASKNSPYTFLSYNEVLTRALHFGCGLMQLDLEPGQNTFIGIYAQNSVEWILTEHACYYFSAVLVPLYDTLGPHTSTIIINQSSISAVVVDKEDKVRALLAESPSTPGLRTIVATCEVSEAVISMAEAMDVCVLTFAEVEALGREHPSQPVLPSSQDLATVCYTSGTTGSPKGVMLTHGNIVADVSATLMQLGPFAPGPSDVMMSFLPCAHMLERVCEVATYMGGGSVGFYSGDIRALVDDYKALRPTITPSVPRLLNRIHDKVMAKVNGSKFRSWLFKRAMNSKLNELNKFIIRNNSIWDSLVFKKVRESMGGRVRLLVCGSAPLAGNVLTFVRCALGCIVLEGYGQTEGVAPCTLTLVGDPTVEHVGPPLPCCAIKLADVPEMEYYASQNKGEVCIRGYNVFKGYLKDPEKTAEALDKDGWLHTGDIGEWQPNNALKIIDRKKHIFKLSQGEYIAPEKIENIYLGSKYISQIFVHGESLKSCLIAVVCPEMEETKALAKSLGVKGSWEEICQSKEIKKHILEDMSSVGKKEGLKSYEQVKDIYLFSEGFSIKNELLTPTLKTKRPELKKYFAGQIEAMYQMLV
ncbi:hypothetical protein LAZ67_4003652 [Cordylochernes scorpioides]|uniref:Long-chain-fatty-acid--CoA ligase n=1 Tax=Cordylochernes scorpioides TaxID=51811 RepID=A0ABY6KE12_9ARAC|nr:hypothetical protein LAZ67_4003652 [Cordylochernes scorpioides]